MRGRTPRWRWLVAGSGALLAVAALGAALAWNAIFDSVLASQLALTPTSRSFHDWQAPSIPLFFEIFLYNWTNPEKFPHEEPNLVELGPYRFREERRHVNMTWHPETDSLSYRTFRSWHFDASSNGSLDDNVTTINMIAASAVHRSRFWGYFQQKGLSMGLAMFNQKISVSKTARELLFDGYEDPLLELAKSLPASTTGGAPPVDRFGWFYERNNSLDTDGYVEVSTGKRRGTLPGQILKWNTEDHLTFYEGECNRLQGSVGEFFPRDLTEESKLTMFLPDLCRTVDMKYIESGEYAGLQYHTYGLTEDSFDDMSTGKECFCEGECSWRGALNVSACRAGAPVALTLPPAHPPGHSAHSFYLSVEPRLGIPVDVMARFQVNVVLAPNPNIALYEDVPNMLFPVFWVQQQVKIEQAVITELVFVRSVLDWGATACAALALAFAAIAAVATCCPNKQAKTDPMEEQLKSKLYPKEEKSDTDRIKEEDLKLNPI